MKNIARFLIGILVITVLVIGSGAIYTIDETEQVVVTQFGEPMGDPITEAGLYFKMPFIQTANRFDKRLLQWDGKPKRIPTKDKRFIWVDTTARWRIVDPLTFMKTVRIESSAQSRLDDIIEGATINAISNQNLVESVRNSNEIMKRQKGQTEGSFDVGVETTRLESVKVGRNVITREILNKAGKDAQKYGIEIVDMRIKRINYTEEVQAKVFERMISERKRAAEQYRSEGQGKKAEIEGRVAKELEQIRSEAYRKAEEIKGKADAEAIKIYADAYNKDPEFYSFIKTLEAYQDTINNDTTLILSTDSEFFKYLKASEGVPKGF